MSQTSIGERLRQAREALPASLAEASRATRVRVDFLEAMERDSFTFISGRVYVVGMLRSYARWLRLDEAEIAREYDRIYGAAEAPALAESLATRNERSMRVQRPRKPAETCSHEFAISTSYRGVGEVEIDAALIKNADHLFLRNTPSFPTKAEDLHTDSGF